MSKEPLLPHFGGCNRCGKKGPLTDKGLCPQCEWPIAGITYKDAYKQDLLNIIESQEYLPITGWDYHGRILLYGYIHPTQTRQGWEILLGSAKSDFISHLILGTPEEVLFQTWNQTEQTSQSPSSEQ